MDKLTNLLVVIVTGCLFLTACGAKSSDSGVGAPEDAGGAPVIVRPVIQPSPVDLRVGGTLEIQIPTIPTEGFEWVPQNLDTRILVQEGTSDYVADTAPNSAGGIVTLRFRATAPGTTTVVLFYTKPSGNAGPSLYSKSYSVQVNVK